MGDVVFAILAHEAKDCLRDLVDNLRDFEPPGRIVVFNGGRSSDLTEGLDIELCPLSKPLQLHKLLSFHTGVMRWLVDRQVAYEYLVCLDSDMLLLRPGFGQYLDAQMRDHEYMAYCFQRVEPRSSWGNGRAMLAKWRRWWQPVLGTDAPYGAFNPGQIFRRDLVERIVRFPALPEIEERAARSALKTPEEVILPTLAVRLNANPRSNPGGRAVKIRRHSPAEIKSYLPDETETFLHKVDMTYDAPERRIVRALRRGDPPEFPDGPLFTDHSRNWGLPGLRRQIRWRAQLVSLRMRREP